MLPFEHGLKYPVERTKGYKTRACILELGMVGVTISDGQDTLQEPWRDWTTDTLAHPTNPAAIVFTSKLHITCPSVGHLSLRAAVAADLLLGLCQGVPGPSASWLPAHDIISGVDVEYTFVKKALMLVRAKTANTPVFVVRPEAITAVTLSSSKEKDNAGYVSTQFYTDQGFKFCPLRFRFPSEDAAAACAKNLVAGTNALRRDSFVTLESVPYEQFALAGLHERAPTGSFCSSRVLATGSLLTVPYGTPVSFASFTLPDKEASPPADQATSSAPAQPPGSTARREEDESTKNLSSHAGAAASKSGSGMPQAVRWATQRHQHFKSGMYDKYLTGSIILSDCRDVTVRIHRGWIVEEADSAVLRAVPLQAVSKIVMDGSVISYGDTFRRRFTQAAEAAPNQKMDIFLGLKTPTLHKQGVADTIGGTLTLGDSTVPIATTIELRVRTGESIFYTFVSEEARVQFVLQLLDFVQSLCLPVRVQPYRLHRAVGFSATMLPTKIEYFNARQQSVIARYAGAEPSQMTNVVLLTLLESLAFLVEAHPHTLPYEGKDKAPLICIAQLLVHLLRTSKTDPCDINPAMCIVLDFLVLILQSRSLYRAAVQDFYGPIFTTIMELFRDPRCSSLGRFMLLVAIRAAVTYQWRVLSEQSSNSYSGFSSVYALNTDQLVPDLSCKTSREVVYDRASKVSTKAFQATALEKAAGAEGVVLAGTSFLNRTEIFAIAGKSLANIQYAYDNNSLSSMYTQGITFSKSRFEAERENRAELLETDSNLLKFVSHLVSTLHRCCKKEPFMLLPIFGILDDVILFRTHMNQQWFLDNVRKAERAGTVCPQPPGRAELFLAIGNGFSDYISLSLFDCRRIALVSRAIMKQVLFEDILSAHVRENLSDYCLSSGAMLHYVSDVISDGTSLSTREASLQIIAAAYHNNASVRAFVHVIFPVTFLRNITAMQPYSHKTTNKRVHSATASTINLALAGAGSGISSHSSCSKDPGLFAALSPFPGILAKWTNLLKVISTQSYTFNVIWDALVRANLSMVLAREITTLHVEAERYISSMPSDALEKIIVTNKPILGTLLSWNLDAFKIDLRGKSMFPLTSFDVQFDGFYLSYVLWYYMSLKLPAELVDARHFKRELLSTLKLETKPTTETSISMAKATGECLRAMDLDKLVSSYFSHFILQRDSDRSIRVALVLAISLILVNSSCRFSQTTELATEIIRLIIVMDYGLAGLCLSLLEVAVAPLATKYANAAATGLHYYLVSYILPMLYHTVENNSLGLSIELDGSLVSHTYGSLMCISLRVILGCLKAQPITDKMGRILIPVPQYKKTLSGQALLPILINTLLFAQVPEGSPPFVDQAMFDLICYNRTAQGTDSEPTEQGKETCIVECIFIQTCELLRELCKHNYEISKLMMSLGVVQLLLANMHGLSANIHVIYLLQELYNSCSRIGADDENATNIIMLCMKTLLPEPLVLLFLKTTHITEAAEAFTAYELLKINVVWTHEMRYQLYYTLCTWQKPLRDALLGADEQQRLERFRFFGNYIEGATCCIPHIHNMIVAHNKNDQSRCYIYSPATQTSTAVELPLIASYPCIAEIEASLAGGIYTALLRSMATTTANVSLSLSDITSFLQTLLSVGSSDLQSLYSHMLEDVTAEKEGDTTAKSAYLYSVLPPIFRLETNGLHEMAAMSCTRALDLIKVGLEELESMRAYEQRLRKDTRNLSVKMSAAGLAPIGANALQHPDIVQQKRLSSTDTIRRVCILLVILTNMLAEGLSVFSVYVKGNKFHPSPSIFVNYILVCTHMFEFKLRDQIVAGSSLLDDGWSGEAFSSSCIRALNAAYCSLNIHLNNFIVSCANILSAPSQTDPAQCLLMSGDCGTTAVNMYIAILALEKIECDSQFSKIARSEIDSALGQTITAYLIADNIGFTDPHLSGTAIVDAAQDASKLNVLLASAILSYYMRKAQLKADFTLPPQIMMYLFAGVLMGNREMTQILALILKLGHGLSSVLFSNIRNFIGHFGTAVMESSLSGTVGADELLVLVQGSYYGPKFTFDGTYKDRVRAYYRHLCSTLHARQKASPWGFDELLKEATYNFTDSVKHPNRLIIDGYHLHNIVGMILEANFARFPSGRLDITVPLQSPSFVFKGAAGRFDSSKYICDMVHFLATVNKYAAHYNMGSMCQYMYNSTGTIVPLYALFCTMLAIIYADQHLYMGLPEDVRVSLLTLLCTLVLFHERSREHLLIKEAALVLLLHIVGIENPQVFLQIVANILPSLLDDGLSDSFGESVTSVYITHYRGVVAGNVLTDAAEMHSPAVAALVKTQLLQIPDPKEVYPVPVLAMLVLRSVLFVNAAAALSGAIHLRLLRFVLSNASRMGTSDVSTLPLPLLLAIEMCSFLLRAQTPVLLSLLPPPLLISLAEQNTEAFYKIAVASEVVSTEFYWSAHCTNELIALCDSLLLDAHSSTSELIKGDAPPSYTSIPILQRAKATKTYVGGLYLDAYLSACSADPNTKIAVSNPSIAIKALCAEAGAFVVSAQSGHMMDASGVHFVSRCLHALVYLARTPKEIQTLLYSVDFAKLMHYFLSPSWSFFAYISDKTLVADIAKTIAELLHQITAYLSEDIVRTYAPEIVVGILGLLTEYYDKACNGSSGLFVAHEHGERLYNALLCLSESDFISVLETLVTFGLTLLWYSPAGRLKVFRTMFARLAALSAEIYGVRLIYMMALQGRSVGLSKTLQRAMVAILTSIFTQSVDMLAEFRDSVCLEDKGHAWIKLCTRDLEFTIGSGDYDPVKAVATNIYSSFPLPVVTIADVCDIKVKAPQPVASPPDSEILHKWIREGFVTPIKSLLVPIDMECIVKQISPAQFPGEELNQNYHIKRYCIGEYQVVYFQLAEYSTWKDINDSITSIFTTGSS